MKKIKVLAAALALLGASGLAAVGLSSPAGADVTGWERIETTGTILGGSSTQTVTSYCTSGKKALGGGYDVDTVQFLALNTRIVTNKATGSGSGWTVTFTQAPGSGSTNLDVAVVAVCGTVS